MVKPSGKEKGVMLPYSSERSMVSMPTALVKFLDRDFNTDMLPICNIPELEGELTFQNNVIYNVFWAPPKQKNGPPLTLPEFKKIHVGRIPRHPTNSGNDCGAGFYPATILRTAESKAALTMAMEEERFREPSEKMIQNLNQTKSISGRESISSGMTSTSCGITSNGKKQRQRSETGSNRKKAKIADSSADYCSDSSSESSVGQLNVHTEEVTKLKKKYSKAKSTISALQKKIQALETTNNTLLSLNFKYQSHLLKCPFRPSDCSPSVPFNASTIVAASPLQTNPSSSASSPLSITPLGQDSNSTENSSTIYSPSPSNLHQPLVEAHDDLSNKNKSAAEEFVNGNEDDMLEIYPGTKISQKLWTGSFREFVKNPKKAYPAGIEGDRAFVKDAARAMFSEEDLIAHSIAGKQCNVNVSRARVGNTVIEVKPPLPRYKIDAISKILNRRVLQELESFKSISSTPVDEKPYEKRMKLSAVNRQISEARNAVLKRLKKMRRDENPQQPNCEEGHTHGDILFEVSNF